MNSYIKPKNALISVFNKEGLEPIINELSRLGVEIFSTGGTQSFIENLGKKVNPVEELTSYPSILGGKSKNSSPKSFWRNFSQTRVKSRFGAIRKLSNS